MQLYDQRDYRRARQRLRGQPCVKCGAPSDTVDHIKSIVDGGTNEPSNLQPMCRSCNSRKGAATRSRRHRRNSYRNKKY